MFTIKIDASDLQKFDKLDLLEFKIAVGDAIAEEAVLPMFRSNPSQTHAPQPFVSAKSRRYFFWALRNEKIHVPYQRSGAINALWEVTTLSNGNTKVASKRKGAKWVIGENKEQARYHAGNWPSVNDVAESVEGGPARDIAERILVEMLDKAGLT